MFKIPRSKASTTVAIIASLGLISVSSHKVCRPLKSSKIIHGEGNCRTRETKSSLSTGELRGRYKDSVSSPEVKLDSHQLQRGDTIKRGKNNAS